MRRLSVYGYEGAGFLLWHFNWVINECLRIVTWATLNFGTGARFILTGGSSKLFRMIYKDLLKNDLQPTAFGFLGSPFLDGLRYCWFIRNTLEMMRIFLACRLLVLSADKSFTV